MLKASLKKGGFATSIGRTPIIAINIPTFSPFFGDVLSRLVCQHEFVTQDTFFY